MNALPKVWLTNVEAAEYLQIKPETLMRKVRAGLLPGHRLPGGERAPWRFLRQELDDSLCGSSSGTQAERSVP